MFSEDAKNNIIDINKNIISYGTNFNVIITDTGSMLSC